MEYRSALKKKGILHCDNTDESWGYTKQKKPGTEKQPLQAFIHLRDLK